MLIVDSVIKYSFNIRDLMFDKILTILTNECLVGQYNCVN